MERKKKGWVGESSVLTASVVMVVKITAEGEILVFIVPLSSVQLQMPLSLGPKVGTKCIIYPWPKTHA